MAVNKVNRIYELIKELPPHLQKELYERLGAEIKGRRKEKVLDELIGIAGGPKNKGSRTYKEDLYGGPGPL
ncbi:MAG: hypothetical protein K6U04_02215 [Armatimonadetes bacterium]|nr:hypothetical protein [Armatimonadota bacterium]